MTEAINRVLRGFTRVKDRVASLGAAGSASAVNQVAATTTGGAAGYETCGALG